LAHILGLSRLLLVLGSLRLSAHQPPPVVPLLTALDRPQEHQLMWWAAKVPLLLTQPLLMLVLSQMQLAH
jgi:hypothetical protein